jgi:hypothetical protein
MTGNTQARKIASPDGMAGRGEIPFTTGPIVRLGSSICVTRISIRLQNPCYEAVLVRRTEDRTIIDVKDQAGFLSEKALCVEGQAVEWIGSWTSTRRNQGIQR